MKAKQRTTHPTVAAPTTAANPTATVTVTSPTATGPGSSAEARHRARSFINTVRFRRSACVDSMRRRVSPSGPGSSCAAAVSAPSTASETKCDGSSGCALAIQTRPAQHART